MDLGKVPPSNLIAVTSLNHNNLSAYHSYNCLLAGDRGADYFVSKASLAATIRLVYFILKLIWKPVFRD